MCVLSVIVCTHDRRASVVRTLASLAMASPPGRWEIVVVANACTDDTQTACLAEIARLGLPGRVVAEPCVGLSAARNRGLRESAGDLLVYLDDDMTVECTFLRAYEAAAERFPEAAAFGGRIVPRWPRRKPRWYPSAVAWRIDGIIGRFEPECEEGPSDHLPFGGNMALRRNALLAVGGFSTELGMNGGRMGFGEESAVFQRLVGAGGRLVYVPDAATTHHLQPQFQQMRYLLRRHAALNVAMVELGLRGAPPVEPHWLRRNVRRCRWLIDSARRVARGDDWQPLLEARGARVRRSRQFALAAEAGEGAPR